MNHTDFYARIRAIKEMEYRELYAAIEGTIKYFV